MLDEQLKEFELQAEKVVSMGYQLCQACHPEDGRKGEPLPPPYKGLCALALASHQALKAFIAILRSLTQK